MTTTFYWHDYETFGLDTKRDRPAKFAGLRTDENLNPLGDPLVVHCKPVRDVLPSPEACLTNGITPQMVDACGVPEPEFIARIHDELERPNTCGVGYNNIEFDDEITRHALYRNFYDPYAREWQNGNSRWDIIDLVRMTYALRPEGIQWPTHEDGRPSFRLKDIAAANDIRHDPHDALSDVLATIAIARLIREKQRGIYDWFFRLRDREEAKKQLDLANHTPVLHTWFRYPPETGCTALVMPLVREPGYKKNGVLVYDLSHDPEPFIDLDEKDLCDCLFISAEEKLPVNSVRINKCPALAPKSCLRELDSERIAIDLDDCDRHWRILNANKEFMRRVGKAYGNREFSSSGDVELRLYEGGFFKKEDISLFADIRAASPQELSRARYDFLDKRRLPELLFRYRARNWPETLSVEETQRWEEFRYRRIHNVDEKGSITLDHYYKCIALLRDKHIEDADAQRVLNALDDWGRIVT